MVNGAAPCLRIPHSRCNDLPEDALAACGYRILTRSREAGVDMFAKQRNSLSLFFQGHPEYDAATLLREYRRDIGRFLRGERENYPAMPVGYFDAAATAVLSAFRERALIDRYEELLAFFPMETVKSGLINPWRMSAIAIYRNWLSHLSAAHAAELRVGAEVVARVEAGMRRPRHSGCSRAGRPASRTGLSSLQLPSGSAKRRNQPWFYLLFAFPPVNDAVPRILERAVRQSVVLQPRHRRPAARPHSSGMDHRRQTRSAIETARAK